jgi:hypothetical protein
MNLILLVITLIALDSFRACAMPEFDGNGKSRDVIELKGLSVQRLLDQGLAQNQTACRNLDSCQDFDITAS